MATDGKGDAPFRSSWLTRIEGKGGFRLLYSPTITGETTRGTVVTEWFLGSQGPTIIESDASIAATCSVSAVGATIVLSDSASSQSASVTGESGAIIQSDAATTVSASLTGESGAVAQSDATIPVSAEIAGDGEDASTPAPEEQPDASGGKWRFRIVEPPKPRPKPKPKPKHRKPRIIEADAVIACRVTVRPRWSILRVVKPEPKPLEAPKPKLRRSAPPPLRVVTGAATLPQSTLIQTAPITLNPAPREKVVFVDFEEEMALALLIA